MLRVTLDGDCWIDIEDLFERTGCILLISYESLWVVGSVGMILPSTGVGYLVYLFMLDVVWSFNLGEIGC